MQGDDMTNRKLWRIPLMGFALGILCGFAATGRLGDLLAGGEDQPAPKKKKGEPKAPPGSPAATQSPKGIHLPFPVFPQARFGGIVGIDVAESKPFWPAKVVPPKGAPNILLIMTDDVGFGAPSTFGGVIPTPALDRVAKNGLRYNKFHSTALCSPTRAALITGRNHHSAHFGVISEMSTGYPGYDSLINQSTATLAAILRAYGYATGWWGKDHNVPAFQASQAGPFDRWPIGMGFDYFYGFVGGDANQWQPNLFRNTTPIYPFEKNKKFNLTTAMADDAVGWLKQLNSIDPEKPFFMYYVPGGTHAPHHPTPEWIEKFKGKFDNGWNEMRDQIFKNQQNLGIIPKDAKLTPWPKESLPEWNSLDADSKKLFARQMEVYAAYLAYTDHEIGRVIQAVEDLGKLDNTMIIYVSGDNGASAEGGLIGTPNEVTYFNLIDVPVKDQLAKYYDLWGSDRTYPHMSCGWTWALCAPFKWVKQVAAFFGGTRQGVAISWPKKIPDKGGMREQFHHIIDIVPTVLDACGIPEPVSVNGVPQRPIEGVSMVYTFDKANVNAPSKRTTQYFEMFGNLAIYHEGWIASTVPFAPPWDAAAKPPRDLINGAKWELYDLSKDYTQFDDLSKAHPEKLKQMKELFVAEASKHNVFPLNGSKIELMLAPRPSLTAGRNKFVYDAPVFGIPQGDSPNLLNRSYSITAEFEIPKEGTEGVLLTSGGRFGGYGLYLLKGRPVFTYNLADVERTRWDGKEPLSPGKHTVSFEFTTDPKTKGVKGPFGKGGEGVLKVDGKEVARKTMERTLPFILQWDETFDVGQDKQTPVDDNDYQCPFAFDGRLIRVTVEVGALNLALQEAIEFELKSRRNNRASE
jgi:arylsulfatase A-like enzyme